MCCWNAATAVPGGRFYPVGVSIFISVLFIAKNGIWLGHKEKYNDSIVFITFLRNCIRHVFLEINDLLAIDAQIKARNESISFLLLASWRK